MKPTDDNTKKTQKQYENKFKQTYFLGLKGLLRNLGNKLDGFINDSEQPTNRGTD